LRKADLKKAEKREIISPRFTRIKVIAGKIGFPLKVPSFSRGNIHQETPAIKLKNHPKIIKSRWTGIRKRNLN